MANDGHYYSTPNAPKGTPARVAAATPRSISNYPTSLRTSLYANSSPATVATYSSRVPLVAHLHATAPPSPRTSLTRVHARPASTSSTTTTTTRRKPRTSNPFEELSAPAFDSFIDTITSTLRSVLEPPPPPPSKSSEERKRREREREERERLREVARQEREQRKRGEDVFGQVVAVVDVDAAASAAAAGQEVDDEAGDARVEIEIEGEPARLCVGLSPFSLILTPRVPSLVLLVTDASPPLCRSNPTASSVNKSVSPVDSEMIVLGSSSENDDGDHEEEGERGSGGEEQDQLGDYDEEEDDVRGQARTGNNSRSSQYLDSAADQEQQHNEVGLAHSSDNELSEQRDVDATSALLEMRQVDLGVGTRTPLFLQRGTASVSTSEADAEELFQRFDDDDDEDGGAREQDEQDEQLDEDEIEGNDQQEEEEEVAGFAARSLYSTTEEEAVVVVDQSDTLLEAAAGEDIYDVDALGEGIQEDVIEMDRGEPEAEVQDDDDDDPSVFTDPFGRPVRYDYGFAEEQGGGASEEYEDYVEYEEREEVEEEEGKETSQVDERDPFQQQRRQEEEEERDLLHRGDGVGSGDEEEGEAGDGGNAMDPAEAEWAGRPTPARPQPRSGSGSPAASASGPAPAAATAAAAQEKGEGGSASPPPRYAERTPAVEVLELGSSDSEGEGEAGKVDGDAGARAEEEDAETEEAEEEADEEEEPGTSLTAQMLGDSEPELAVESTSAAEQQQEEEQLAGGEALIDVVEANDVEAGVDNPEEPMDLSNAPPTPAAVSFEPEPSAETPPVAAAADAEPTFVAEADADQSMELGLGSTATTPALQTPAAVPDAADSYFGPSGEAEDREAVESGALADVDEDVVMQEQQPEPTSAPLSQAADAAVDLAEEVEIATAPTPSPQVALPLQGPAAVPASSTAEAGVKAFEVDEANLADVEEGGDVGVEAVIETEAVHQVQPQPDSKADSLVVTAIEGQTQSEDVSMQQSGGEASRSPDAQAGESAERAGSRTNPLEALYEHEDSEVGRIFQVKTVLREDLC